MNEWLGMPPNFAEHGAEIDNLMMIIHVVMAVLFIGWGIFFVYVLVRFRGSKNKTANYNGVTSKSSTYLEIAVLVIEVVLLIAFSIPIYAKRVSNFPNPAESVEIRILAEQFAWNIHYPGADGVFGETDVEKINSATNPVGLVREGAGADDIVTVNQLHVPVGKPSIIYLSSKDVIHCLNLPVLRIKQDIIPGMNIPIWFVPTQEAKSEIACAQLCGLGHYRMKGFLTIESQESFDAWLAEEAAQLAEEGEDDFWDE